MDKYLTFLLFVLFAFFTSAQDAQPCKIVFLDKVNTHNDILFKKVSVLDEDGKVIVRETNVRKTLLISDPDDIEKLKGFCIIKYELFDEAEYFDPQKGVVEGPISCLKRLSFTPKSGG